jgi:hypothetical protein
MIQLKTFFLIVTTFLSVPVLAQEKSDEVSLYTASELTLDNYKVWRKNFEAVWNPLVERLPKSLQKSSFKRRVLRPRRRSPETVRDQILYDDLYAFHHTLEQIDELKSDFVKLYERNQILTEKNTPAVHQDAENMAVALLSETARLKEEYKSFFIPTLHNLFISMGIKKRGACKHWAEDLLMTLRNVPRKHFSVTWGEAYPGKAKEHNVAVIFPKGSRFEHGILYDPWRTSGKPYWVGISEDSHYPWQKWSEYDIY